MAATDKTIKASAIRTKAQFDKAVREGRTIIFDDGYPTKPKKRTPRKKK